MPAIILRKMGPINAFNLLKDTKAVRVGIVYRYLILRHKDFVNMIVLFYVYTQTECFVASKKHQSRFSGLVRGTPMPFLFLCSKPGEIYRFGKRNHYPILIPKTLVISHPRFKPYEAGLPYSPIPIFEQLSKSHPSPSQSWSCQKINQISLKSSESRNYGINFSIIATKIQHINESSI